MVRHTALARPAVLGGLCGADLGLATATHIGVALGTRAVGAVGAEELSTLHTVEVETGVALLPTRMAERLALRPLGL